LTRPILVIGIGNTARGDDALGHILAERVAAEDRPDVEVLLEHQLQVEHALDLERRALVIFLDATLDQAEPVAVTDARPAEDATAFSHALSPGALLSTYTRVIGRPPPRSVVVALRGTEFELGAEPSATGMASLERG